MFADVSQTLHGVLHRYFMELQVVLYQIEGARFRATAGLPLPGLKHGDNDLNLAPL
jgi:hypothetical protein